MKPESQQLNKKTSLYNYHKIEILEESRAPISKSPALLSLEKFIPQPDLKRFILKKKKIQNNLFTIIYKFM